MICYKINGLLTFLLALLFFFMVIVVMNITELSDYNSDTNRNIIVITVIHLYFNYVKF